MRQFFLLTVLLILSFGAGAQNLYSIKGTVADSVGPIPGVIVKVKYGTDSLTTVTELNGVFTVSSIKSGNITLSASLLGYAAYNNRFTLTKPLTEVGAIILKSASNQLNEVIVKVVAPVKVKEDTVQYDAGSFKVRPGGCGRRDDKKTAGRYC